jgi:hypothetical protein
MAFTIKGVKDMKKSLIAITAVLALVLALGAAGLAYAQSLTTALNWEGLRYRQETWGYSGMVEMMNGNRSMNDMMREVHGDDSWNGSMSDMMREHHGEGSLNSMRDMMNGSTYMGGAMMSRNGEHSPMHEYMLNALAADLGLPADELEARMEAGELIRDIANGQGLSEAELQALMQSAHNRGVEEALSRGLITGEEAGWMNNHMQEMLGEGAGGCHDGEGQAPGGPNS